MLKAFNPQNGPLIDLKAVMSEREGASELFAGAMGYFKNPFSHCSVGTSHAVQAASLILFANELIARVNLQKITREEIDAPRQRSPKSSY